MMYPSKTISRAIDASDMFNLKHLTLPKNSVVNKDRDGGSSDPNVSAVKY